MTHDPVLPRQLLQSPETGEVGPELTQLSTMKVECLPDMQFTEPVKQPPRVGCIALAMVT